MKASQQGVSFKVNSSLISPCFATKVGYLLGIMVLPSTYDGHVHPKAMAVTTHAVLGVPGDMLVLNITFAPHCHAVRVEGAL